jgi:hypothetical protein
MDNNITTNSSATSQGKFANCKDNDSLVMQLNSIWPLFWVILGSISNILAIYVFLRKSMRLNSTFVYLLMMSVCDCLLLSISSLRDYLAYMHKIYVSGSVLCKVHTFLFFFLAQLSSWLLVGANLDRLVSIISNKYSKTWCTRRMAVIYLSIVCPILFLINGHLLVFVGSHGYGHAMVMHPHVYPKCTIDNSLHNSLYLAFYSNIYLWLDSFVYSLLPFVIVGLCNSVLIVKVFATRKNVITHGGCLCKTNGSINNSMPVRSTLP